MNSATLDALRDTLFALRRAWATSVLSGQAPDVTLCHHPLAKEHPIARVLAALLLKEAGLPAPPIIPLRPLMPLFESCQLALLWALAGEESAHAFASFLLPFTPLPTLWCKESECSESDMEASVALLRRAFGEEGSLPSSADSFFLALEKRLPRWEKLALPHRIADPELGLIFQKSDTLTCAVTLAGDSTSLGALRAPGVEVRAFGPHISPLSNPQGFGLLRQPDSQPIERWAAVAEMPEVWMEAHPRIEPTELALSVRFLGQKVQAPLYFTCYIKTLHARIGEERYLPRTLQRYQGDARPVLFGDRLYVESLLPGKMELIPLSGAQGFWHTDFLLAFEVPPFDGRGEYRFKILDA